MNKRRGTHAPLHLRWVGGRLYSCGPRSQEHGNDQGTEEKSGDESSITTLNERWMTSICQYPAVKFWRILPMAMLLK